MKQFNLEEYLANERKVVTRDGRNVRIICTDAKGTHPVIVLVDYENSEVAFNATKDGGIDGFLDLFFAPEKHEGWVNIFKDVVGNNCVGDSTIFNSKEDAEKEGKSWGEYITSVKVEWEE